ncbi:MAG: hypothetical protein JWP78_790 [Mucilaginibacter sp.]|nr:hypothetical protein [Mucilaginibacter sp.]
MKGQVLAGTRGLQINSPGGIFRLNPATYSGWGYYAPHESSIETNSSFYKLPRQKSLPAGDRSNRRLSLHVQALDGDCARTFLVQTVEEKLAGLGNLLRVTNGISVLPE